MHASVSTDQVILAIAIVQIKYKNGKYLLARSLLDSGSQINFITEELAQRLNLQKEDNSLNSPGIGKMNSKLHKISYLENTPKVQIQTQEFVT